MSQGKVKRFKNIQSVRRFVGYQLRQIAEVHPPGSLDAARVLFTGARLLAELIQHSGLEDRIRKLEKQAAPPADEHVQ